MSGFVAVRMFYYLVFDYHCTHNIANINQGLKLTFLLEDMRRCRPGSGYVYLGMALKNHAPVLFHS